MIVDLCTNLARYKGINGNLDKAIDYVLSGKLNELTDRTEIDGTDVYAMLQHPALVNIDEQKWENHFKYADIHIAVEGAETLGYLNTADGIDWTDVRAESDVELSCDPAKPYTVRLDKGMCAIVWPGEPHKPNTGVGEYTKAVIKIKM